jgi:voltage-gated potassium channel
MLNFKRTVYALRQAFNAKATNPYKRRTNITLSCLVFINVIAIVFSTSNDLYPWVFEALYIINYAITFIFAVEYFLRMFFSGTKKLTYVVSFASVVDIISIFPSFIAYLFGWPLTHFTILRLLRIYKFFRTTRTMKLFASVLRRTYRQLLFAFLLIFVITIIFSSLMFYVEHNAQPHKFSSIIATMWWVISSLTTAGYVPMNPITVLGKVLSSVIVVMGVSLFAIPAGIISAGFIEEYKISKQFYKQIKQLPKEQQLAAENSDKI